MRSLCLAAVVALSACAAQAPVAERPAASKAVSGEVNRVRMPRSVSWTIVGADKVLMDAQGRYYLIDVFGEIDMNDDDERIIAIQDDGYLNVRMDSLLVRGHRMQIERITQIDSAQAERLVSAAAD